MTKKLDEIICDFENETLILGIDEAGRGPVLGPMVYACCYYNKSNEEEILKVMKFDDSKKLTEAKREKIFEEMKKYSNVLR
jgi:ribonuclease H2 subunit A